MIRSVWDGDWLPATKETLMDEPTSRLGPPTVISLDRLAKLAEQAIADHSVCVNEDCPGERIIPPSLRWFVEDYLPAVLTDGSPAARASQAATDEPELTAADRSVLAAQNGERCIHVDPHQGHQCTLTAGHDTHIANGGGWTLLPGEDDVLPVRASQAAIGPGGTGDDAGAAHDPHGAAAGHTEAPLYLVETSHCGKWRHGSEFEDLAEARDYAEYCHATYGDTRIVRVTREVVDQ